MKRLSKILLALCLVIFSITCCSTGAKDETPGNNGVEETSVKSADNIITVTTKKDGLLIHVDLNDDVRKYWKHNTINVQEIKKNDYVHPPIEVGIPPEKIKEDANAKYIEFLFPFVKKDGKYKVWINHYGNSTDEWADGGNTEKKAAEIIAAGGAGELNVTVDKSRAQFWSGSSGGENGNPKFHLSNLSMNIPELIRSDTSIEQKWRVRCESNARWGKDEDGHVVQNAESSEKDFPIEGDIIKNLNQLDFDDNENNKHFSTYGKDKLFFIIKYRFEYDGLDYSQNVFDNYDKWISEYHVVTNHFPLIKIISTENNGSNDFITEPIAKHVKEAANGWGDHSRDEYPDPWYEKCEIYNGDTLIGNGQVKVRGNWTTDYPKKSLRIKFDDKQKMFGLNSDGEFKNWVLLAAWKDSSFLRDAVGLKLYHKLFPGYASDCRLVEVEVNGANLGVYLLAEQQEAKRLGLTEPKKNATNTDIGYLIEFDSYSYTEAENEQFEIDYLGEIKDYNETVLYKPQNGYTIKSDVNDKVQHDFIADYMNKLWKICYEAVYNHKYYRFTDSYDLELYDPEGADANQKCENCINEIIDLGSLADFYIFNEIVCDPDLYLTSFFMNVDFAEGKDKKLYFNAPWDFDSTMGNKSFAIEDTSKELSDKINMSKINEMFAGLCQTDVNCHEAKNHANPWMVIFIREAWFQNIVKERWGQLNISSAPSDICTFIDDHSADTYQPVYNFTRAVWGTSSENTELCEASRIAARQSQKDSAKYLKDWLTIRISEVGNIISSLESKK